MAIIFSIEYKKNDGSGTELVCEDGSKHVVDEITSVGQHWGDTPQNWSRDGFTFKHWNTAADDSGTSYNGGDLYTGSSVTLYAIWQADTPVGADVSVTLGNTEIASLSDTGSVTLATARTYVNEDITIDYTKSGGGGGFQDVTSQYMEAADYPDGHIFAYLNRATGEVIIGGQLNGGPMLMMTGGLPVESCFGTCTIISGYYYDYKYDMSISNGNITMPSLDDAYGRVLFAILQAQGGGSIY